MRVCALALACRSSIRALLGRALCIRHIDAGSCNGCELEIHALNNPLYNLEGLGIRFVASPRHADLLLVTGPVSRHMEIALRARTRRRRNRNWSWRSATAAAPAASLARATRVADLSRMSFPSMSRCRVVRRLPRAFSRAFLLRSRTHPARRRRTRRPPTRTAIRLRPG